MEGYGKDLQADSAGADAKIRSEVRPEKQCLSLCTRHLMGMSALEGSGLFSVAKQGEPTAASSTLMSATEELNVFIFL